MYPIIDMQQTGNKIKQIMDERNYLLTELPKLRDKEGKINTDKNLVHFFLGQVSCQSNA